MTSVPNRHQLLNGSNLILLLLALAFAACTSSRSAASSGKDKQEERGELVYNPRTGEYERVEDPRTLVDTVALTEDKDAPPPIGSAEESGVKKNTYAMTVLMPFNAQRYTYFQDEINPKTRRFIHYYAGMKMALEDLEGSGVKLDVRVEDTREDASRCKDLLKDARDADVVVGPYNRDCLEEASRFSEKERIPVFSPWTPSLSSVQSSEYFVQVTPGLTAHAEATLGFIAEYYPGAKVFLALPSDGSANARVNYYKDAYTRHFPRGSGIEEVVFPSGVYDFSEMNVTTMLSNDVPNIFLLPYYSPREQEFLNAVLRKLHAEKHESSVVVFGLPQWLSFYDLNPDYLEALDTYITAVQYVDASDPDVQRFAERFYNTYHTVPEPSAIQGYQLTTFIGNSLNKYGTQFIADISRSRSREGFDIAPVFRAGAEPESRNNILYYENQGVEILKFENLSYRKWQ